MLYQSELRPHTAGSLGRRSKPTPHTAPRANPVERLCHPQLSADSQRPSGGGRIRTYVGVRRQIYSLLPLATRAPHHARKLPTQQTTPHTCPGWQNLQGRGSFPTST
jgi:hypothetical protein